MSEKILIVDDEPDIITFLSAVLQEAGYATIGAKDGIEALEILRKEKPGLVLLDLMMPKKSGITVLQELRKDENTSHIPVVVVTGVPEMMGTDLRRFMNKKSPDDDKKSRDTGETPKHAVPDAFIEKPIDPEELFKVIKQALKA